MYSKHGLTLMDKNIQLSYLALFAHRQIYFSIFIFSELIAEDTQVESIDNKILSDYYGEISAQNIKE